MVEKETSLRKIERLTNTQKNIRNVATSAHIHHGKTAFTDNLLAAAGMMASKNAGDLEEGMTTWQHGDEQERLMTVDAANVSMGHEYAGEEYLINLIDTPGHVDFGGNVTRAMRAIDGTFVLVCAVEGIMPQTETVLKQALRERVKPVLFINKVDRLIKELKLTPEQMQERFAKLIQEFNRHVMAIAEQDYKEKWQVNVADGSVAFGSARENWALSVPFMKKKNITFLVETYFTIFMGILLKIAKKRSYLNGLRIKTSLVRGCLNRMQECRITFLENFLNQTYIKRLFRSMRILSMDGSLV